VDWRRSRLRAAADAFASNAVNPNLRRAQLSFLAAWTAEWAFTVALGIVAYRDGGATTVGLMSLLRTVPSAVVAPLAAPLADRGRRERVLVLVSTFRGATIGAVGVVVAIDGPVLIVYVLSALATVVATLYLPAHSALLPSLCRTGHELTSANVVRGFLDSVATLLGPLLAAVLLELTGVSAVFAVAAGALLAAAAILVGLRYVAPPRPAAPRAVHVMAEAAEGIRTIVRNRDLALLKGVPMLQPLPLPAIEQLARGLEPVNVSARQVVIHQGDPGDRFYLIEKGRADVVGEGRLVTTLGPGEGFGEIALLRRVRRTATVQAATDLKLYALRCNRFLPVVTGFPPIAREASTSVEDMLDRFRPGGPTNDQDGHPV
jgi:Cyclic nucleotide-binding domain/Major Facilitator Superfamily